MASWRRTTACERAAQWLSLELDGELSPLEQRSLVRHLHGCAPCRHLSAELVELTELLREAPFAVPKRELVLPAARRPRRAQLARRGGLVVSLAAGAVAFVALLSTSSPSDLLRPPQQALAFTDRHEQIEFVRNKYRQMEPLRSAAIDVSVPTFSRRALR